MIEYIAVALIFALLYIIAIWPWNRRKEFLVSIEYPPTDDRAGYYSCTWMEIQMTEVKE